MTFDPEIVAKIVGPLLTLVVGAIVKYYSEAKSKVVSFIGHTSQFRVPGEKPIDIHTHSVVVRNTGRKTAKDVRLVHNVLPPNITVYPPVDHKINRNPDGTGEIVIALLVPKEQVTVSYLYFPPLVWGQINAITKSDDGFAEIINAIPIPQPSKVLVVLIWSLAFVGASFVFYWMARLAIAVI